MNNLPSDELLVAQIKQGDQHSLDFLFRRYYRLLVLTAIKYVVDEFVAEELVQDLFLNLWQKRKTLAILGKIKTYLLVAIKNRCLNYLKTRFARQEFVEATDCNLQTVQPHDCNGNAQILKEVIDQAISQLPDKCRCIFLLSRRAGMSYQEIADDLSLSKKTIEAQMGIALKRLREFVNEYQNKLPSFKSSNKR